MPLTLIPRMRRMSSQAKISSWRRLVRRIDAAGEPLRNIDDHELRKKSLALKYEARCGKQLEELLVDAYALVREAGDRAMGMRHYEVQLLAESQFSSTVSSRCKPAKAKRLLLRYRCI